MEKNEEYKVKLEVFEGPLDLLLYLIKKDELDISNIPMESVTRQYIEYLEMMKRLDLNVAGEFLVMAATLMMIKSRMLLPAEARPEEEDEEEDPRWDLVRQLVEYKKFKVTWLRKEEVDKSFGLIIYQLPYKSTNDFSEERLTKVCDSVTKKYIPGPTDGSYMTLDREFVKPVFRVVPEFPATYAVEMRGMWKTEGEFMAGPYVAYTFVNPQSNRITTIEGYIYYPNKPKRDLLRQLEAIIWSLKF